LTAGADVVVSSVPAASYQRTRSTKLAVPDNAGMLTAARWAMWRSPIVKGCLARAVPLVVLPSANEPLRTVPDWRARFADVVQPGAAAPVPVSNEPFCNPLAWTIARAVYSLINPSASRTRPRTVAAPAGRPAHTVLVAEVNAPYPAPQSNE
jgi:hypothetical protein